MSATYKKPLGRLPYEIREEICRRLRDRQPARLINDWLISAGHTPEPYSDQNYTNFRKTHYRDWLKNQARNEHIRKRSEQIRQRLEAGGLDILDDAIYTTAEALAGSDLPPNKIASAIADLKTAVNASERVKIADRRTDIAEQALQIQRKKFQRDTCQLFLRWYQDQRAREIADDTRADTADKIEQLGQLIFQEDW